MDSTDQNPPESYEMLNHKWSAHIKEDQFRGCMLGGAVGDALGAPIEFMTLVAIKTKFGSNGITEFAPAYGKTGAIMPPNHTLPMAKIHDCTSVRLTQRV